MITSAFRMSRSESVLGRPRGRVTGSSGQGSRSTRATRLTSRLGCCSISVPSQCGCVGTEILRGQPCCGEAWRGCVIYDHVSTNYLAGSTSRALLPTRPPSSPRNSWPTGLCATPTFCRIARLVEAECVTGRQVMRLYAIHLRDVPLMPHTHPECSHQWCNPPLSGSVRVKRRRRPEQCADQ
jgi:hypothetical protein